MTSLWIPAKIESFNRSVSEESTVRTSNNSTKFNFEDRDVMVFLHNQKTSGSFRTPPFRSDTANTLFMLA